MRKLGLLAIALTSCLCTPPVTQTCVDRDGDGVMGAMAGCPTGTDCDDNDAQRNPNARERCNGGIDDDCNSATLEVCSTDAGEVDAGAPDSGVDAGEPDAGTCMCTDNPSDCTSVAACALDAGAPVCFSFALADRTACLRTATDGGAGLCQTSTCVECIDALDCGALNSAATVCDLVTCSAGRCESIRRHDTTAWKVTPPLSAELIVNLGAVPLKAMWDGENFAVALVTSAGDAVVRRVARDGTLLDPIGFPLSPRVADVAFSGGRFLQVTSELANGGAQPFDFIGGAFMSYDGGANTAMTPLIWDVGTTNPNAHFVTPSVAGSASGFMVVGSASQYFWAKHVQLPSGASGEITTPFRPRYSTLAGAANGFTLGAQDLMIGGGSAEAGGAFFPTGGAGGYAIRAPFNPPFDPDLGGACCGGSVRLASNGSTFLLAHTWDGVQAVYRPFNASLQPTATRTVFSQTNQTYQASQPVEMHSDGVNFLIVSQPAGASLKVLRVTPQGDNLDPAPFEVSSTDAFEESRPRLVSDGRGRNLLLYQKTEGVQPNSYVRLFTTCP